MRRSSLHILLTSAQRPKHLPYAVNKYQRSVEAYQIILHPRKLIASTSPCSTFLAHNWFRRHYTQISSHLITQWDCIIPHWATWSKDSRLPWRVKIVHYFHTRTAPIYEGAPAMSLCRLTRWLFWSGFLQCIINQLFNLYTEIYLWCSASLLRNHAWPSVMSLWKQCGNKRVVSAKHKV